MADENTNTGTTGQTGAGSSDGTQNTAQETRQDNMIPKSRFDEVNRRMRDAEKLLADLQQKQTEREESDRLAKGEHEKVIAELKPQAESAKKMAAALEEMFRLELEGVPEDMRDLIPEGDVSTRLTWLKKVKTRGLLSKPAPPVTDAGAQGAGTPPAVKLTDEERAAARSAGMTDEQYAKYKIAK